ncbi:hypothetical protein BDZ45DRAFT_804520 [Acephala macrosclerotiorum]|nr:hypothetical protein BDZ45DRAFT_804520 [Acephala macrosclerotiorum]
MEYANKSAVTEASTQSSRKESSEPESNDFIQLRPQTHDISFTENHIPNIQKLGADLNAAVQAVWPSRHQSRYVKAHVLMISWEGDDLGVWQEIVPLRTVFEEKYHFQVEEYKIPSIDQPDRALKRRSIEFLDSVDKQDTLLIVYYAGHARKAPDASTAPLWCASRSRPEPTIASAGIQSMFEEAEADVLILYDCCHSAACLTNGSRTPRHVVEVIAACGYETVAAQVDKHSFTKALLEILALKAKGGPFSVGDLHARVLSKLKCWAPDLLTDAKGKFLETHEGHLVYEHQPRRTPVYSIVCETEPRRSILLCPLPKRDCSSSSSTNQGPNTPSSSPDPAALPTSDNNESSGKRKRDVADDGPCPQILLAIRLERNELDIPRWVEWIRNLPAAGKDIRIEGLYESFSSLVLLRMPVAVWSLLPQNPSYSFVGFITSENLSPRTEQFPVSLAQNIQNVRNSERLASVPIVFDQPYMGMPMPPSTRWQSAIETLAGSRELLSKPSVGGPPVPISQAPAPAKKRGRPPKSEVERRNRAAIQRGEVFPAQLPPLLSPLPEEFATSPYAAIAPTRSGPSRPPTSQGYTEQAGRETHADDSPGREKRQRAPAKPPKAPPAKHPGESSFSVNPPGFHPSTDSKKQRPSHGEQVWYCCQCHPGGAGAISFYTDNCPNCGHLRDGSCAIETVKIYDDR